MFPQSKETLAIKILCFLQIFSGRALLCCPSQPPGKGKDKLLGICNSETLLRSEIYHQISKAILYAL